jgi:hypothetical protein
LPRTDSIGERMFYAAVTDLFGATREEYGMAGGSLAKVEGSRDANHVLGYRMRLRHSSFNKLKCCLESSPYRLDLTYGVSHMLAVLP